MFFKKNEINYDNLNYKQKVGVFGERLAIDYLRKKGYKLLKKNVKVSYKEIDLICQYKDEIVFVEVKTRLKNSFSKAEDAMTGNKLKHLIRAISMYVAKNKINPEKTRLDLIAIDLNKINKTANIKHFKEIF
ncbi:YraN family protein [Candidatus Parcubacteria bacterium]|nr:YraN family protein [Candidatus Parcubacteria bacterium]